MGLLPADFPQRLMARGLPVTAYGDWLTHGGSADHRAIVLHHTASASSADPAADAAYCHHGSSDAPLYNVLCDRTGHVWLLAREKANSSGSISSVALNEALRGQAGTQTAAQRGLHDDTSANASLLAICGQNNGTGEPWSDALVNSVATVAAVACECLGLTPGHVTEHRILTQRKIDPCGPGCPV